jgi:hypothetical protein
MSKYYKELAEELGDRLGDVEDVIVEILQANGPYNSDQVDELIMVLAHASDAASEMRKFFLDVES